MKDQTRVGTFSSSNIWKLMTTDRSGKGWGAPALKYIKQVNYERLLGRAISSEQNAKPTSWGTLVERAAFELLPLKYTIVSGDRLFHSEYKFWTGAPDLLSEATEADIKCPFNMEMFCDKVEALKNIETYKREFPEDYWQHVSNCILSGKDYAEAIIYCPYKKELELIREIANNYDGDQNKIAFLNWASDDELPYLIEGRHYKNLNIVQFEIPQSDKDLLTEKITEAGKLLIQSEIPIAA